MSATSTSTRYLVTFTADDKHPNLPDRCQHMGDGIYVDAVVIIDGYTTLEKETVVRILTNSHRARYDNITPLAAYQGEATYLDGSTLEKVFA